MAGMKYCNCAFVGIYKRTPLHVIMRLLIQYESQNMTHIAHLIEIPCVAYLDFVAGIQAYGLAMFLLATLLDQQTRALLHIIALSSNV